MRPAGQVLAIQALPVRLFAPVLFWNRMNPDSEYVDGVDVSLIRWSLSLTPAERLDVLEEFVDFLSQARNRNGREPLPSDPPDAR